MSRENVEVIQRGIAAFNAEDMPAFLDLWDRECEWFTVTGSRMAAAPYKGHEGIRRYLAEREESWTRLRFDTERLLEGKSDDVVVAIGCLKGEGRRSGVSVVQRIGVVYELRDGRVRSCRAYPEPSAALEAAGLRE